MNTPFILSRAGRLLFPLLLFLSLLVLYRGHNLPGGGFIGGLLAAASFLLVGLGDSMAEARRRLRVPPVVLMGIGLGVPWSVACSGCSGVPLSYGSLAAHLFPPAAGDHPSGNSAPL